MDHRRGRLVGRRPALAALALALALATGPRGVARAQGAAVAGTVYDSVALAPLRGADVRLVSAERPADVPASATTDSLGRFTLGAFPAGRYVATFWHPRLDSLGLTAGSVLVTIRDTSAVRLALATPAAARVRAGYCGTGAEDADSTGVLVGYLLGASDRAPAEGGAVTARWLELELAPGTRGVARHRAERVARAGASGWFALCGVPLGSDVTVSARHGADSSGTILLRLPGSGVARRDLYVGAAARGRIAGTVRAAPGRPIRGARLTVDGSDAEALTDERGEFVLRGVPEGTRTLSARAVGYFPEDRAVDVLPDGDDAAAAAHLVLASVRSVLDTIRVVGRRVRSARVAAFEERRRLHPGTFLDSVTLERRNALRTSDLPAMAASMTVVQHFDRAAGRITYKLRVRGGRLCLPLVYLDGLPIPLIQDLREIDALLRPADVQSVELYTAGQAPAEIARPGQCAFMVITTKW